MGEKKVTSHDQKGGITAFNVNAKLSDGKDSKGLPKWAKWLVAIAGILSAIAAIITLIIMLG